MKILHLIDSGGLYGAEMMLVSLATAQEKMGLLPVIGSIRKKGIEEKPLEQEAKRRGLKVQKFEMQPGPNIKGILEILRYAKEHRFDLFHSHGYKTNILLGLMPFFLRGRPIVTTLHGWTSTGSMNKMRLNEELDAFSLHFVDRIVLVNKGMLAKKKVQHLPKNKIRIINNGIEIEHSLGADQCHLDERKKTELENFCKKRKIIASIGRLSHEKGFEYLIEAVRILRDEKGQDVRLLLIGDGRQRKKLEQQALECGLRDYFYITGYIKNARALLGLIDYYVISSLTEGLPITLLEVMASKTPIVATAVGGIPYVVEDGWEALLVPAKNPGAIADAVHQLFQDQAFAIGLAVRAEMKVRSKYGSSIMAEMYRNLYLEVLKKRNKSR